MDKQEHAEHSFTAIPESIPAARAFAEQTLEAWQVTGRVDDVRLCVSELASNAVNHGSRTDNGGHVFHVRIDADDTLIRVEVEDDDPLSTPHVREPGEGETGGRGMLIVETLSAAWGYESHDEEGKAVWTEFLTTRA